MSSEHAPEVGISHLAGPVDDAAHDRDGHAWEVPRPGADLLGDLLQVEQRAPAAGTGHVLRLGVAHPRSLRRCPQEH